MAEFRKSKAYLRNKKGSSAVEFIFTAAMLILIFSVLVSALVYVTQFYSASYICRRVVRTIEVTGVYDELAINSLSTELNGDALDNLAITVDASYWKDNKIQLKDEFTVHLDAVHRIDLMMFRDTPLTLDLPIDIDLSGRSEVYWK